MQVGGLDSNWGISPRSAASNPTCSWPPQCRIVILIASARLQGFSFVSLSWKHPGIVFCVTNRQTLQFFFCCWTHSFVPTRQILLCYSGTPEIRSWLFLCCCPSILFDRRVLCKLLFLWWKPAAIVQIHFVKGFEGRRKKKQMVFVLFGEYAQFCVKKTKTCLFSRIPLKRSLTVIGFALELNQRRCCHFTITLKLCASTEKI